MAVDGPIVVKAQSLNEGAADADAIAAQIEQQMSDLKGFLAPLVGSWTGEASSDYQALQGKWNAAAEDLNAVLRQIAQALRTAAENYIASEGANAQMWLG